MSGPSADIPDAVQRAATALGREAVSWQTPPFGLSAAERFVIGFDDGSGAFAKAAVDERTAAWLRDERGALAIVGGRLGPDLLHWEEGSRPLLVTADLSGAYWPVGGGADDRTLWRPGDVDALLAALAELRTCGPLPGELRAAAWPEPAWEAILADPALTEVGLCSAEWADRNGATIVAVDRRADPRGSALVHGDVRSDNVCLLADGGARLVDWSESGRGDPDHDLVQLLPTLHLEGGPAPASILGVPAGPIVRLGGATVHRALRPGTGPAWLGQVMLRLAAIDLAWIAAVLEIEPPATGG